MGNIENYRKSKSAQINLNNGEKAFLSYGTTDMRVFTTSFFPKTIHIFDNGFLYNLNSKIGYDVEKDIVKILADKLSTAESLKHLKDMCLVIEDDKDFIDNI